MNLKFSIITVSFNSERTIGSTILSVAEQTYPDIEYIIIDGGSADGTLKIIDKHRNSIDKLVSEPDAGIYDAINKGIKLATGDVIGILNSDDFFSEPDVIQRIADVFKEDTDAVYGDVRFVGENGKTLRYYSSRNFNPGKFKYGFMPAHPSLYARKELFQKYGMYKTDYKIAADFELMIRFLHINNTRTRYVEMPVVNMRPGGVSNRNISANFLLNQEILRACRENGIKTNLFFIYSKYFKKVFELFVKH